MGGGEGLSGALLGENRIKKNRFMAPLKESFGNYSYSCLEQVAATENGDIIVFYTQQRDIRLMSLALASRKYP